LSVFARIVQQLEKAAGTLPGATGAAMAPSSQQAAADKVRLTLALGQDNLTGMRTAASKPRRQRKPSRPLPPL
jgi:hypothetical protein